MDFAFCTTLKPILNISSTAVTVLDCAYMRLNLPTKLVSSSLIQNMSSGQMTKIATVSTDFE